MLVIGVDPGIEKTGIGIVEEVKNKQNLVFYKLIKTDSSSLHCVRLSQIFDEITEIVTLFKPESAAIEKLFFAKNIKTAMTVSEARGVIILALQKKQIPIHEYTPLQIKQALVGYGRGTKNQILELVRIIVNKPELKVIDDVADGIACAITHLNTYKMLGKINKSIKG
jgi:crossover junction endodeoxyribonuclease RuvC